MSRAVSYFPPAPPSPSPTIQSKEIKDKVRQRSPLRLCAEDLMLLMRNLRLCVHIVLPMRDATPLAGVPKQAGIQRDYFLVGLLTLIEVPLVLAVVPAFAFLPGWAFMLCLGSGYGLIHLLSSFTWGSIIVESAADIPAANLDKFKHEKWIFINGIATTRNMLGRTTSMVSATFGRPVTGIHNRSFGILGDLLECLVQRTFGYETEDVRVAYESVKAALEDDDINKVVVIAHSQGGILISLVLDHLYTTCPIGLFSKLEIYTFGSAAAHFHNPLLTHPPTPAQTPTIGPDSEPPSPEKVLRRSTTFPLTAIHPEDIKAAAQEHAPGMADRAIRHIEHYVNSMDMVPTWGVLYHVLLSTGSSYSGSTFVHENASGHLFDQHYLEPMFPLNQLEAIRGDDRSLFLNHRVRVEPETSTKLDEPRSGMIYKARTWTREMTDAILGRTPTDENPKKVNGDVNRKPVADFTVKGLSRLWRYMDGGMA